MTRHHDHQRQQRREAAAAPRHFFSCPICLRTAALFAGFYAIVAAMGGRFEAAAAAIFIAMVLDGADGRIARMTNTQSGVRGGVRQPLRRDFVRSGACPGALRVVAFGHGQDRLARGLLLRGRHCAASRTVQQPGSVPRDKRYFQGLPCPAAAAVVAGSVWFATDLGVARIRDGAWRFCHRGGERAPHGQQRALTTASKDLDLKGRVPFMALLLVVVLFVFVSADPPSVLFTASAGYAASGPVMTLVRIRRRRAERRVATDSSRERP